MAGSWWEYIAIVFGRNAVDEELFISGVINPAAVVLHRGPTHFSPDGEHCCVRLNLRRCVTFSECDYNCLVQY